MTPSAVEREALFKTFARGLFKSDVATLYTAVTADFTWSYHDGVAVTKTLLGADAILAHLAEQRAMYAKQWFHEVAYHHLPDRSFMTFRVTETVRSTGEQREQRGIEHYLFRDGRIATKDVYRKPIEVTETTAR